MNELIANAILAGLKMQTESSDVGNGYVDTSCPMEEVVIDGTFNLVELADYIIGVLKANAS